MRATTIAASLALLGFAANSIFCRMALGGETIDAASFTAIRLGSGAAALWLIVRVAKRTDDAPSGGSALSALALFVYAAAFSFAYLRLSAGVGALVLFGSVQATMIGWGLARGERLRAIEWAGLALALAGLAVLGTRGSVDAEPIGLALMSLAGVAWGAYSIRGRTSRRPLAATASNFLWSVPLALLVLALDNARLHVEPRGVWLALASGIVASGLGYSLWYFALPALAAKRAALVQLLVPVLVAAAGVALLGEQVTRELVVAAALILGGVGLATFTRRAPVVTTGSTSRSSD